MQKDLLKTSNIEAVKDAFIKLVGEDTWQKESSFAIQIFRKNPKLLKSNPESILDAVLNVAQIGLTLNPANKLAYLIPRYNAGQTYCTLEPSYQGLCKLVTDTGSVRSIQANVVYKGDEFEVTLGTSPDILHKPKFESKKDDDITHVYAVADLGTSKMIEVMTIAEVKDIASKSESVKAVKASKIKTCVWYEWFSEMARKTVIRRIVKYLPKTDKWDKVNKAIELQEQDFKPSWNAIEYALSLIETSTIEPEKKELYYSTINHMTASEVEDITIELKGSQRDAIESGQNYSQTDILNKLKNEI